MNELLLSAFFLCLSAAPINASIALESLEVIAGDNILEEGAGWIREVVPLVNNEQHLFKISRLITEGQTPFQDYVFIENATLGKMLFLNGAVQSSQNDEKIYHETLVQPAMVLHAMPKTVLVIGAGEGATAREILRHKTVERVVLVDIDDVVVEKTKELLPEWHEGAFDDPRVELVIMDGKDFIERAKETFDVIVIDVCDKLEEGPTEELYSKAFYQSVKTILNPSGVLVVQAMEMSEGPSGKDHRIVYRNIDQVFEHVATYGVYIPSFWSTWGFVIASDDASYYLPTQLIDQKIQERGISSQLKHYDGQFHQHLFHLNKSLRRALAND